MEKYECKTVPLTKLVVTPVGPLTPLCNTCINKNCGNPVEEKSVSVFGKVEKHKIYSRSGIDMRIVIECKGYIRNEKNDSE